MKKIFKVLGVVILVIAIFVLYVLEENNYISYKLHSSFEWAYNYRWKLYIPDAKKTITLMHIDYNDYSHEQYIVKFKYDPEEFKKVSSMVENDYPKRENYLTITSNNEKFDVFTYINNSYISKVGDDLESQEFLEKVLSLIGDNKKYIVNCRAYEHSFGMWYDPLSILIIDEEEQTVYEVYST